MLSWFEGVMLAAGSRNLSTNAFILLSFLEYAMAFAGESIGGWAGPV